MQTNKPTLEVNARTYFLAQGQSIIKLQQILDSSLFGGLLKRGISILLEILLFLLFLCLLLVVILIPLDPIRIQKTLTDNTYITVALHNDDVTALIILIKVFLFIASLMPLLLIVVMVRNRRKGALINEAYLEVEEMKEKFDEAVKELKL